MNHGFRKKFLALGVLFLAVSLPAQEALKSAEEEYYDFLSLMGKTERPTLIYRTLSDSVWEIGTESKTVTDENGNEQTVDETVSHPWQGVNLGRRRVLWQPQEHSANTFLRGVNQNVALKIYGPDWFNSFNTAAPYGQNDGALWQGKGYNMSFSTGARVEAYGVELTVKPQVSFSQNMSFKFLPGVYGSEYSYFWKGNIDLVQRYGDSSFWTFDWGDTEIRYTWHTLTAGFGFQSPWLGPAWLNPMLGSNNAPTYPKFDIGLRRTEINLPWLGWYIGDVEGRIWVGRLEEADYFDNDPNNNYRQITGFSAAYSPSFLPGLTIGATKICINDWRGKSIKYLNPFYSENEWGDGMYGEDQKISIFADWIFPQVGFEVYGELGIDDSGSTAVNPFHTAIFTAGVKKSLTISKKHGIYGEIIFEYNNFEMSQDFQLQWKYMGYYAHGSVSQSYTQKGQILGAGSGYFGNSQFFGFRVYYPCGNAMLFYHRHSPDNNYIHNMGLTNNNISLPDKEHWAAFKSYMVYGISALYHVNDSLQVSGEFDFMMIYHPYYNRLHNDNAINNIRICLGAKYNF